MDVDFYTLEHPCGATAQINFQGATLTSFKPCRNAQDVIFVSKENTWTDDSAIRGGIPVVFPQFGKELNTNMVQHGFFRSNRWRLGDDDSMGTSAVKAAKNCKDAIGESVQCRFCINESDIVRHRDGTGWEDMKYEGEFVVSITKSEDGKVILSTELNVTNNGQDFEFSNLQHTYYAVNDHKKIKVTGVEGYDCIDTMLNPSRSEDLGFVQGSDAIIVDREIDRIFYANENTGPFIKCNLRRSDSVEDDVAIYASASIDGEDRDCSVVVWNPWIEKSRRMDNFGDEEYKCMICVEPGLIRGPTLLKGGSTVTLTQSIVVLQK